MEYDDASWRCWLVLVNLFTRAEIKKHIFSNRSLIKIHNSAADEEEEIMRWYIFMTQLRPRRVPVVHELAFAGTALSAAAGSLFHKKKKRKRRKGARFVHHGGNRPANYSLLPLNSRCIAAGRGEKREDRLGMVYKAEQHSGGILLYARFWNSTEDIV